MGVVTVCSSVASGRWFAGVAVEKGGRDRQMKGRKPPRQENNSVEGKSSHTGSGRQRSPVNMNQISERYISEMYIEIHIDAYWSKRVKER